MIAFQNQKWIQKLEKVLGWIAIPNLAVILVTLQALGFVFVMIDPAWIGRLALLPDAVRAGEYFRLITFLALPLSTSLIWVIFSLWFLYFVVNLIEEQWGAFKTTFYVLISVLLMITFSFTFDYPITQISGFESTLFLAAAALFPEMEIQLFLVIPVKIKWLAWFTIAMVIYHFVTDSWVERIYLLAIYCNYLLFFGPAQIAQMKQVYRKRKYIKDSRS